MGAAKGTAFAARLRAATRACHDEVDTLFGRFDLSDRSSYARFLTAHAAALVPVEDWVGATRLMPDWRGRKEALWADLAALGRSLPHFEPLDWPRHEAARWGAFYVLEGSRLGGAMLSRAVPEDLPRAYLSSVHAPGAWRGFLAALDEHAQAGGPDWEAAAIASAGRVFALYAQAARLAGAR
ncbi:biliverdin-producing heme oxygenase [Sphingobium sp. H33]|uniref:Biliverdin-producing heme oxygenase n=2 Tax=Sphingobium nicotianae TaxID=2782607 RepID=A0A9X1IPA1_9SPHN|nr:biliverdin-producing heme oxygenase [Sphingobium nicotianae]